MATCMVTEPQHNCEFCEGKGFVLIPEYNTDAHQWEYVDVKECICTVDEPDDFSNGII